MCGNYFLASPVLYLAIILACDPTLGSSIFLFSGQRQRWISWYTENTYPTLSFSRNKLDSMSLLSLGAHPQQNKRSRRGNPWLLVGDSLGSQEHLASKVLLEKGCKNLSWGPTVGWLLSWEPSGSGHTASLCTSFNCSVVRKEMFFSFYCSCRTLAHRAETFHSEFSVCQGGSKQ